ncbi:putative plasmid-related outer membrane ATPase [Escherichia coli]|uniref:Putative plasmid-related outer membrane ATPase n=1 Tax=Escherichia coli TaxID=562 RepID=A0A376W935_ECOLX|nr:putative plasmid-related outer membrane ATPase [Escherichia coli]
MTVNPLLSPYMTKVVKMWRKLGAWLWLATQNLKDYPDISEKMLNMAEWWVGLTMPPEEVNNIARFKIPDGGAEGGADVGEQTVRLLYGGGCPGEED